MEILLMLLPLSFVLVAVAIAAFNWAVNHGQFDELERHAVEVLDEVENLTLKGENENE